MSLNLFKKSLKDSIIVKRNDYSYIVHPLLDGIPELKPELLDEVVSEMYKRIKKIEPFDKIVTVESMGIPLATALSIKMNKPLVIIRKKPYGLPGEIIVDQKTGYSKSKLYINNIKKDDKIIIIDDVLSTGGTIKSIISTLKKLNTSVEGVFIAVNKSDSISNIKKELNVNIDILVNITIDDNKIIVK